MSDTSTTGTRGAPLAEALFVRAMPALFVMLWSNGFLVSKLGVLHASPLTFLAWRYAIALALLLPMPRDMAFLSDPGGTHRARWDSGSCRLSRGRVVGDIFGNVGWARGVDRRSAARVNGARRSLARGTRRSAPVDRFTAGSGWGGTGSGEQSGLSGTRIALCVIALLSITVGTLYQKRYCPSFDLRTGTLVQYRAAFAVTLPFALTLEDGRMDWGTSLLFALGWSAVVLSFGAILLLFLLIRRGATTRLVSLFYLTPPTTALMAWLLFGESLSVLAIVGIAIAVFGVALVVRKSQAVEVAR